MDIQDRLFLVLEALAPHGFPDSLIRSFVQQFSRLLANPNRSPAELERLIFEFRNKTRLFPAFERLWSKLDDFVRPIFTMSDKSSIMTFINNFYLKLQEQEQLQSSIGNTYDSGLELNKLNLNNHDQYIQPLHSNYHLPSLYAESFETVDKISDKRSLYSSHYGQGPLINTNSSSMSKIVEPFYINTIPEDDILKSVFYTLLGASSSMFPIESNKIQIPNNIPNSTSGILHLIFEAGLLYIKLISKVEQNRHIHVSPMKKALLTKLNDHLHSYTKYVNTLSHMPEIKTLKGLYNKLFTPILQLRVYEKILSNFESVRGDEYLTKFHSLNSHGNMLIRTITKELYNSLIIFYYDYMLKWLTLSKLESTFEEFFIEYNSSQLYIPYKLNYKKIPDFIPENIAKKIFIIGTTCIYLTKYCNELQWANNFSQKFIQCFHKLNPISGFSLFFETVQKQYTEIVNYTWDVLLNKQYFRETIHMLRDVLLMGKDDLISSIIHNAKDILNENSSSLNSYIYTRILSDAIQQSSLKNYCNRHDNNALINRLDSRVLDLGQQLSGWDVFTLEYDIPPVLSIILNVNRQDGRKEYLRIFNFLWKFKRIDYLYNKEMIRTKEIIHSFKTLRIHNSMVRDIINKLSKLSILRSQLHQFNSKVESFYFQHIIASKFNQLEHDLQLDNLSADNTKNELVTLPNGLVVFNDLLKPSINILDFTCNNNTNNDNNNDNANITDKQYHPNLNIEQIYTIHNKFLNDILSHPLLSSSIKASYSDKPYPTTLIEIFSTMRDFISNFTKLHDIAHQLFIQISLESNYNELSNSLEQFNETSFYMVHNYRHFKYQQNVFIRDLRHDKNDLIVKLGKLLK